MWQRRFYIVRYRYKFAKVCSIVCWHSQFSTELTFENFCSQESSNVAALLLSCALGKNSGMSPLWSVYTLNLAVSWLLRKKFSRVFRCGSAAFLYSVLLERFSKGGSLLNILYQITTELTFENFSQFDFLLQERKKSNVLPRWRATGNYWSLRRVCD